MNIQATCRQCGQKKSVEGFTMSAEAQQVVCGECAKTLRNKANKTTTRHEPHIKNVPPPKDWDEEDVYLARQHKNKTEKMSTAKSYRCPTCGYVFVNSPGVGKIYTTCPFCRGKAGRR